MKKGKEFVFPENVNKDFSVWHGFTIKDIGIMLGVLVVGILLFLVPPYDNLILVFIKITMICIAMTIVMAILSIRPIKSRKNIKVIDIYRIRRTYRKSQKLYYIATKEKRNDLHVKEKF